MYPPSLISIITVSLSAQATHGCPFFVFIVHLFSFFVLYVMSLIASGNRFLEEKLGRAPIQSLPYPVDRFEMDRREFMARETG